MTFSTDSFSDLATRFATGAMIAVIGLSAVRVGGGAFIALVLLIVAALIWELAAMLGAARPYLIGLAAAGLLFVAKNLPFDRGLLLILLPGILGLVFLQRNQALFLICAALIMVAAFGLLIHRENFGFVWMLWLVLIVAGTDVFGYFAGRIIGGPKFWPRVSPKKTWSGTMAGWGCAGAVGAVFMPVTDSGFELICLSIALSIASQIGDIAESAVKRQFGFKDSSGLLPGHGGVFDRFDGMVGAALLLLLVENLTDFPPPLQ
ncbi:MAG: phosphatidate cytidylyltransferase [Rhodobacteraceae bacterium]|nr:phosphatidate cytidylyltransferase [Paracoccaceae bacterium]